MMQEEYGMREFFERARYSKLYGNDSLKEECFPSEFWDQVHALMKAYRGKFVEVRAILFKISDFGQKLTVMNSSEIQTIFNKLLYLGVTLNVQRNSRFFKIILRGNLVLLPKICKILEPFDFLTIKMMHLQLGCYSPNAKIRQRIEGEKTHKNFFRKIPKLPNIHIPGDEERDLIRELAPLAFPWLKDRKATLQKIVRDKDYTPELRFYRNSYDGGKHPIVFTSPEILQEQIDKGAFCFIADSVQQSINQNNSQDLTYVATIDMDPSNLEYEIRLEYLYNFVKFCIEEVGLQMLIVTYSGNLSFHVKIMLSEPDNAPKNEENHDTSNKNNNKNEFFFLPKTLSFETYLRRHTNELSIASIRDAIEMIILAYNYYEKNLDKVSCRIPKFSNRNRYSMFFDNRTIMNGGARVPLSYHTKSGLFSVVMEPDTIPKSEPILQQMCTCNYIKNHHELITMLEVPSSIRKQNFRSLFSYTKDFLEDNFEILLYHDKIFNYGG